MPSDRLAIIGHHAGHGPAERRHTRGDPGDLTRAMHLRVLRVGTELVDRPTFDFARGKGEVQRRHFMSDVGCARGVDSTRWIPSGGFRKLDSLDSTSGKCSHRNNMICIGLSS